MRPIKLTMLGFVSYREHTEIDFTKPKHNLFLVTGETGSGKSAIFDAITYALYGEASSDDNTKSGAVLRSRYREYKNKEPFVELTFSEGGKEYTVRRTISYILPNGNNSTPDVELKEQGKVVATQLTELNNRLIDILGLSKKQFMQVSMLAQGEFRNLLRDKTKSKKDVYRRLFQTEVFEKITKEFDTRAKEISACMDKIFEECRHYASGIVLPEDFEDKDGACDIRSAIAGINAAKKPDITRLEAILNGLNNVCAYLRSSIKKEDKSFNAISEQRNAAQEQLNTARALLSSFEALEEAERKLSEYASREADILAKKSLSEKLSSAYEIAGCYELFDNSCRKLNEAEQNLKKLNDDLPVLREKSNNAAQNEAKSKEELEKQNKDFAKVEERVKLSLEIFRRINARQKEVENIKEKLGISEKNVKEASDKLSGFEEQEKQWKSRSEKLANASVELAECKHRMEGLEKLFSEFEGLRSLFGESRDWERKAENALEKFKAAKAECDNKEQEYGRMQNAYLEAQAGILAKTLEVGCKCPVCGSLEHPEPCRLPEDYSALTRESIDKLRQEVEKYRGNREKAAAESEAASTSRKEKQNQYAKAYGEFVNDLKISGSVSCEPSLEKAEEILKEKKNQLQGNLENAEKAAGEFNGLQKKLKSAEDDKQKLRDEKEAAINEAARLREALTAAETECSTLEKQKNFSSEEEAQGALSAAEQSRGSARAVWEKANSELAKAKTAESNANTLIKKYQTEIPVLKAELSKYEGDYRSSMERLGLAEDEWKDLTGKYSREEIRRLQEIFTAFDKDKANATGAADTARKAIGKHQRPDIKALSERVAEQERIYGEANARLNSLKNILDTDERILNDLNANADERAKIVKDYNLVANLHNRLSGGISGEHVDIETFVQRYYLDKILDAANNRFMEMTNGEYEFRMTDIKEAGQSKNKGLDLMALSHNTGKEIEVRMLSGGESFAAAMAISLGMADVIRAKSAAVRSEILFIDEGFGGMSESYRNPTVRILQKMAEGSQLVGIISHVSELEAAIDDRLVVTKDADGSHAKWHLG